MTLPAFELHRPRSVEEATALLDRYGDAAAVYCGGTELLLVLKLGLTRLDHLIDLKRIDELGALTVDDSAIVIGAGVTHTRLERDPAVAARLPALQTMERSVANIRVRTVGTVGGNLCFGDPHSDPATFLLALDAEVECRRGAAAPRRLALHEFAVGPYTNALTKGELLLSVHVPLPSPGALVGHEKFSVHEYPTATVTCLVRVDRGRIAEARIAVGSVGLRSLRADEAERMLLGAEPDDADVLARAAVSAAEASQPQTDANGSADYKANIVRVLVGRCLTALLGARAA